MTDPQIFEGCTPGRRGGMVELKDGRWAMVGSRIQVSDSDDRGRTQSASESLRSRGEPIVVTGDLRCVRKMKHGIPTL